ncbi:hypothetical protein TGAMA5MH_00866 [Trichoderma gamsii]|uniref:Uncharacterized protein n=1 Tax=Trichoderma gamsii TaxID=398673 RepID=A0A2K0TQL3_9HYPO|nr:hypothetical protein TGAMA5MH_00866 [Trichoderma gamsii]
MRIGFLGLGMMGTPMAINLCRKFSVVVWNRSDSRYDTLIDAGAAIGKTPSHVAKQSDIIFIMLFDGSAIQSIINSDDDFMKSIRGKIVINTSSVSVDYSHQLSQQIHDGGGNFIEMPVSGSKIPAEQGQLVGMIAGNPAISDLIKPIVEPITSAAVYCGPIGSGLKAKYAVNLFLVSVTAGLAESMNLARSQGLSLESFGKVLNACPLASAYSRVKIAKILKEDWSPQAAMKDCYNSTQLIRSAAQKVQVQTPLIEICHSLYRDACNSGWGEEDMMAIYKLFTQAQTVPS